MRHHTFFLVAALVPEKKDCDHRDGLIIIIFTLTTQWAFRIEKFVKISPFNSLKSTTTTLSL